MSRGIRSQSWIVRVSFVSFWIESASRVAQRTSRSSVCPADMVSLDCWRKRIWALPSGWIAARQQQPIVERVPTRLHQRIDRQRTRTHRGDYRSMDCSCEWPRIQPVFYKLSKVSVRNGCWPSSLVGAA